MRWALRCWPSPLFNRAKSRSTKSITTEYEDIVNTLLQELSFHPPAVRDDLDELEGRVKRRMRADGVPPSYFSQLHPHINSAVRIASYAYPYVSPTTSEEIATYTAYAISIDDKAVGISDDDLQTVTTRILNGQPQSHPLLDAWVKHLRVLPTLFGPCTGDLIIKNSLEFATVCAVEDHQLQRVRLSKESALYPAFLRVKTGISEAYAAFCFPEHLYPEAQQLETYLPLLPVIVLYLNNVNDILSFYKEEIRQVVGCHGFVYDYAQMNGITMVQALRQVKDKAIEVVRDIRAICAADARLAGHMEQFMRGYIMYHLASKRYRLYELNIPAAVDACGLTSGPGMSGVSG